MKGRRNPFVAREGIPFLIASVACAGITWNVGQPLLTVLFIAVFAYLFLIFRDPIRAVPAAPLGVVCPVDGTVVDIGLTDKSFINGDAHKVIVRINSLGTYTARCPVEGKIMDFHGAQGDNKDAGVESGLWVRTDEGDDVVLQFHGHRFGLAPRAFMRYGERVGQGQRCAYLRLTRFAEVQLPINGRVLVEPGQQVSAGTDLLAKLPHP
ncbi:MAG: phosphatidylserine decarboxylase [Woeseiaceae bacterium]